MHNFSLRDLAANGTRKYQLLSYDYGHRLKLKVVCAHLQRMYLNCWGDERVVPSLPTIQNNCDVPANANRSFAKRKSSRKRDSTSSELKDHNLLQ